MFPPRQRAFPATPPGVPPELFQWMQKCIIPNTGKWFTARDAEKAFRQAVRESGIIDISFYLRQSSWNEKLWNKTMLIAKDPNSSICYFNGDLCK